MLQQVALGPVWQDKGFVFTRPDGRPLDPAKVTNALRRVVMATWLAGIPLHDLRHTHASLMPKAGVDSEVIQERLGHASVAITMDVYGHLLPGMQEDGAARFSKLLSRGNRSQ